VKRPGAAANRSASGRDVAAAEPLQRHPSATSTVPSTTASTRQRRSDMLGLAVKDSDSDSDG
jgi:hypothetical protein